MALATAFLVAAAIAFCNTASGRQEPRCTETPVVAVADLDRAQRATLHTLATRIRYDIPGRIRTGAQYRDEGRSDRWQLREPGESGDCEDRLLWAARELRRRHPELAHAYRFVIVHDGWAMAGNRRVRMMHLVLVVESDAGRVVLDTRYAAPRSWNAYAHESAFSPSAALSGEWVSYR